MKKNLNIAQLQQSLAPLLAPFSVLYRLLMVLRRKAWNLGLLRRMTPTCPCISVGNIAWGGTGKTPVVDWLMGWAEKRGIRTVVLSRGYKADLPVVPVYVTKRHTAREVGDEPLMLALKHPRSAVLVDPDRRRSGAYALRSLSPNLMVLDDGFQHIAIRRDLDVVVLRPEDLRTEWERVIPAGSWREGASALRCAHAFLIKATRAELEALLPALRQYLLPLQRPVFGFSLRPERLEGLTSQQQIDPRLFFEKPYALVTGVGNPEQVKRSATRLMGHEPSQHLVFSDHYHYSFHDINTFEQLDMPILCTAKDAVKLRILPLSNVWVMQAETVFETSLWCAQSFPEWLDTWWEHEEQARIDALPASERTWTGFDSAISLTGTSFLDEAFHAASTPKKDAGSEEVNAEAVEGDKADEEASVQETASDEDLESESAPTEVTEHPLEGEGTEAIPPLPDTAAPSPDASFDPSLLHAESRHGQIAALGIQTDTDTTIPDSATEPSPPLSPTQRL